MNDEISTLRESGHILPQMIMQGLKCSLCPTQSVDPSLNNQGNKEVKGFIYVSVCRIAIIVQRYVYEYSYAVQILCLLMIFL